MKEFPKISKHVCVLCRYLKIGSHLKLINREARSGRESPGTLHRNYTCEQKCLYKIKNINF
jgi:hypothetical protein